MLSCALCCIVVLQEVNGKLVPKVNIPAVVRIVSGMLLLVGVHITCYSLSCSDIRLWLCQEAF